MWNERSVSCSLKLDVVPEKVIRAFTDQEMLHAWWGVERSFIQKQPGGVYLLMWEISGQGIRYISSGIVAAYDPLTKIHIDRYMYLNPERPPLGPLTLTVDVSRTASGSLLRLTQGPYPAGKGEDWDWYYAVVAQAWPAVLQGLKKYLES